MRISQSKYLYLFNVINLFNHIANIYIYCLLYNSERVGKRSPLDYIK